MRQLYFASVAFLAISGSAISAAPVRPIEGVWVTELMSEITISPCDFGHCGYLTKIVIPPEIMDQNQDAILSIGIENFLDYNNKDPLLRDRPMLGLQIVTLLDEKSLIEYEGEVYNPQDGNTYFGKIEVLDENHIRLTGCGFFNLICKSEDWARAEMTASN